VTRKRRLKLKRRSDCDRAPVQFPQRTPQAAKAAFLLLLRLLRVGRWLEAAIEKAEKQEEW